MVRSYDEKKKYENEHKKDTRTSFFSSFKRIQKQNKEAIKIMRISFSEESLYLPLYILYRKSNTKFISYLCLS